MSQFRVIITNFEINSGPVLPRMVIKTDSLTEAYAKVGEAIPKTNGGVAIIDQHDCVWFDWRNGEVDKASSEQRRFYQLFAEGIS